MPVKTGICSVVIEENVLGFPATPDSFMAQLEGHAVNTTINNNEKENTMSDVQKEVEVKEAEIMSEAIECPNPKLHVIVDWVKDKATKAIDRAKANPKAVAGVGAALGIGSVLALRKKSSKPDDDQSK